MKISICTVISDAVNEEIKKRGTKESISMFCAGFYDELVFTYLDDGFVWHVYRLNKIGCEKFFGKARYNGENYLDKLIRKATT